MADTQFRLRGTDSVSRLFQRIAEQGHYGGRGYAMRQGVYVCTAAGHLLSSTAPTTADKVLAMMQAGLQAWNDRAAARSPRPEFDSVAWEDSYPVGGLVLTVTARNLEDGDRAEGDRRGDLGAQSPARSVFVPRRSNFDHVWYSKAEALQWIPSELEVGQSRALPDRLVARIVCFHLLDSVNGPLPRRFAPEDHVGSWIRTEIVALDASRIDLRITGSTRAHAEGRALRGAANRVETRILGHARFERSSQVFEEFEAVALGTRAEFRGAEGEISQAEERIGFALTLAPQSAPRTPPFFLHRYDVEWVTASGIYDPPVALNLAGER